MGRREHGYPPETGIVPHGTAVVTGVPGVGKDWNLNLAMRSGSIPRGVRVVGLGGELLSHLKYMRVATGDNQTRDDIRSLDPAEVDKGIRIVAPVSVYNAFAADESVILNAHIVYKQGDKLVSLADMYQGLGAINYVFIYADPRKIYKRRREMSRRRLSETTDEIDHHQTVALQETVRVAHATGAGFTLFVNEPSHRDLNMSNMRFVGNRLTRATTRIAA